MRFLQFLLIFCTFLFTAQVQASPCAIKAPPSICFSPDGGCEQMIVDFIGMAKKSIRVAVYSFTSKPISDALLAAHKRGVDVKIVADYGSNFRPVERPTDAQLDQNTVKKSGRAAAVSEFIAQFIAKTPTKVDDLAAYGIPVRFDKKHAIMHKKEFIVDERSVESGSYNPSYNAEHKNAENARID